MESYPLRDAPREKTENEIQTVELKESLGSFAKIITMIPNWIYGMFFVILAVVLLYVLDIDELVFLVILILGLIIMMFNIRRNI